MKVTYYYRPKAPSAFSIEGVFSLIREALAGKIQMAEYYCTEKWKRLYSLLEAPKVQGDINHITGDVQFLALVLKGKKTILTIHDVGHYERTLTGIKKKIFKLFWLDLPLSRVAAVTTISEFTKSRILAHTNVPASKVHVIYNPAPADFTYSPKTFDESCPAILQVGGGLNKNIHRLIEAIEGHSFRLILVRKRDAQLEELLIAKGIAYEWHERIPREELVECYRKCDILFFASEYEGFGVPIIEANATGRVVITGNVASMPEIAADAAVLVNPFDVNEIRVALLKLKNDSSYREVLIQNGLKNLERFAPERVAQEYFDLYEKTIKNQ
ncbi:Glycosyltransferase involved in cell wall bisynthesis [Filimonas lacunae]|uniref:Glycosyltransferase involved in cell wall bisynthesis n=1 Tax=Filimonas lacunae TaxID=477680 RepID=A0A173M9V0_9BACT|nr:glycosyltransferase family 1 protein [Filimonas lacunae]BAV04290.1 glycosyltransferase [Filimonas lacunae]SIT30919.1 Glycosyltransferase involved in cell wall bisynthesis [Filimonas lacunae]